MQQTNRQQTQASTLSYYSFMPQTFLGKVLVFLVAALVIVLAVVFSVVFLAAGALLLIVAIARSMWIARTTSDHRKAGYIDGEFTVEPERDSQRLTRRDDDNNDARY